MTDSEHVFFIVVGGFCLLVGVVFIVRIAEHVALCLRAVM